MKTLEDYIKEAGEYGKKLYLKNDAIRNGNWKEYQSFVNEKFSDVAIDEIGNAMELSFRIKKFNKQEFKEWIARSRVNMLTSDLYVLDEGSILSGSVVPPGDLQFLIGDGLEDLIECNVSPSDVLNLTDHEIYWVDPIVKA